MPQYTPSTELNLNRDFQQQNTELNLGVDGDSSIPSCQLSFNATININCNALLAYDANVFRGVICSKRDISQKARPLNQTYKDKAQRNALITKNTLSQSECAKAISYAANILINGTSRLHHTTQLNAEFAKALTCSLKASFEHHLIYLCRNQMVCEFASPLIHNATGSSEYMRQVSWRVLKSRINAIPVLSVYQGGYSSATAVLLCTALLDELAQYPPYGSRVTTKPVTDSGHGDTLLNLICPWIEPNTTLHLGILCQPQGKPIPVFGVIFVSNSVDLIRADTGERIALFGATVGIDNSSFAWQFSADVAYKDLSKVDITQEQGIEVVLTINSHEWRFILDGCDDSASMQGDVRHDSLKITGKSRTVLLAHPYFEHRGHVYEQTQSVVQIAESELARHGNVFTLDWQLIDQLGWQVPRYSYTNKTPINALQDIAMAAGGFINAHPRDDIIHVLSNYPSPSWEWSSPDITIDGALVLSRDRKRIQKPSYNGVLVTGTTANGVTGLIKRQGTAGNYQPPQVSHQLITEQSVAIHRGKCELSQTGDMGEVSLSLPMHSDIGLLTPSTLVQVDDEAQWLGMVRGNSISVSLTNHDALNITQRVSIERHWDK